MSTHEVLVVKIEEIIKHDNADLLEIVKVSGYDYSIISKKGDFQVGDLGIFIEPDYVVKTTRSEFSFLFDGKETKRIRVKKIRGIWSQGLLLKAKPHHNLGDNVMDELEITRWEPPATNGFSWGAEGSALKSGMCAAEPRIPGIDNIPKYDLENYKKHSKVISTEDLVYYTTKIHGASARFVFWDGQMHAGSRTTWKRKPGEIVEYNNFKTGESIQKETPANSWWTVLEQNPWIEEWCRKNPGLIVYGEVFGSIVQGNKFHYGYKNGAIGFRVFDVLNFGNWASFKELVENPVYDGLKLVPVLYCGKHDPQLLFDMAEMPENSLENCGADHVREGIVIKPAIEKIDYKLGRVALKYVSNNYLMKS